MSLSRNPFLHLACGVAYTGLLCSLGFLLGGIGHGSNFFFACGLSPVTLIPAGPSSVFGYLQGVGFVWWVVAFGILSLRPVIAKSLVVLNYMGILFLAMGAQWGNISKVIQIRPVVSLVFVMVYVAGQFAFWHLCKQQESRRKVAP